MAKYNGIKEPGGALSEGNKVEDGHALLFREIKALRAASQREAPPEELEALLAEFLVDLRRHFREEEASMASLNHKGFERHRAKHELLLAQIDENVSLFRATGDFTRSFFDFLTIWLTFHDLTDRLPDIQWNLD